MLKVAKALAAQSVLALGILGSAHAAVPDLYNSSVVYQAMNLGPSQVESTFRFSLSAPGSFGARIMSFGFDDLGFSVQGTGTNLSYAGLGSQFETNFQSLPTGSFSAILSGTSVAFASGYNLSMFALPVPEPSQWLLMGAGLTIIAFIAKRRSMA